MCFLFVYYVSRLFSIYFFFSVPFIGFPITSQNAEKKTKNPKSRSKSVEACLPNKCVCPPVCPTASSPKAQTFEPPLTIQFDVLFAQFFLVIKAAVFYMEFWFMTGLPQESRQFFDIFCFLQIHQHSEQNVKLEITQKVCKVWLINVLFPKKSGKNGWEKFCESFVYVYNCGVGCTCHERNMKKKPKYRTAELHLAHLELDHPLGFSLNPLWKV